MADIRDSDTIPTQQDKANAIEMFAGQNGELDTSKMANTIARLHRKETYQQYTLGQLSQCVDTMGANVSALTDKLDVHRSEMNDIKICLLGDSLGTFRGMIAEHKEQGTRIGRLDTKIDVIIDKIGARNEAQEATTKKIKKSSTVPDANTEFVIGAKYVVKASIWVVGSLFSAFGVWQAIKAML